MLPHYDEIAIRKEISNWDISIPGKDQFDFESFSQAYALQVQYRNRLTEMHSVVFAHFEMISQAQKMLKEMAVKLAQELNTIKMHQLHLQFILLFCQ